MTQKRIVSTSRDERSTRYFIYGTGAVLSLLGLLVAVLGFVVVAARAQDTPKTVTMPSTSLYAAYFVADDSDGINQLWGLTLPDGQSKPLTHAPQSVSHYAISADHTQIAYVSDNQIWRQTMGETNAEALVTLSAEPDFITLAFSLDGQALTYHNNGLWLLDLATQNTEELLTDVPLPDDYSDMSGPRRYFPISFLDNDHILVSVVMWEATTRGIYILSKHTMQEVAGAYGMLELTPLDDGRYLVYSETRVGLGVDGFLLGQPADDPLEPFLLTPYLSEFFAAQNLTSVTITDAVEVAPGQLRFIGSSFNETDQQNPFPRFIGTYNFNTSEFALDTSAETLDLLAQVEWVHGMSGSGRYVAGYLNANYVGSGGSVLQYTPAIVDFETRTRIELTVPSPVMYFEWADRQ
jgi:hypothetical protein